MKTQEQIKVIMGMDRKGLLFALRFKGISAGKVRDLGQLRKLLISLK